MYGTQLLARRAWGFRGTICWKNCLILLSLECAGLKVTCHLRFNREPANGWLTAGDQQCKCMIVCTAPGKLWQTFSAFSSICALMCAGYTTHYGSCGVGQAMYGMFNNSQPRVGVCCMAQTFFATCAWTSSGAPVDVLLSGADVLHSAKSCPTTDGVLDMTDSKPLQNFSLLNVCGVQLAPRNMVVPVKNVQVYVISMQYMIIEIYTIAWCLGERMPDNVCATFARWAFNFDGYGGDNTSCANDAFLGCFVGFLDTLCSSPWASTRPPTSTLSDGTRLRTSSPSLSIWSSFGVTTCCANDAFTSDVHVVQVFGKYIVEFDVLRYNMGWGNEKGNGGWNQWGSGGKGGKPAEEGARSDGERYAYSLLYKEREKARQAEAERSRELEKEERRKELQSLKDDMTAKLSTVGRGPMEDLVLNSMVRSGEPSRGSSDKDDDKSVPMSSGIWSMLKGLTELTKSKKRERSPSKTKKRDKPPSPTSSSSSSKSRKRKKARRDSKQHDHRSSNKSKKYQKRRRGTRTRRRRRRRRKR